MSKGRLEAFSDGVLAIIITIMVLEMKPPHGADLEALKPLCPVFFSYVMSFVYVGIYWNNHHHLMHATKRVTGRVMWANHHLLFWLSLIPFASGWVGEHPAASGAAAAYGVVLLMASVAWILLARSIVASDGEDSVVAKAFGVDGKTLVSCGLYASAAGLAFVNPLVSYGVYAAVAGLWFLPDRRIERSLRDA